MKKDNTTADKGFFHTLLNKAIGDVKSVPTTPQKLE